VVADKRLVKISLWTAAGCRGGPLAVRKLILCRCARQRKLGRHRRRGRLPVPRGPAPPGRLHGRRNFAAQL